MKESSKTILVLTNNRSWGKMIKSLFPVHRIDTHVMFNNSNAIEVLNENSVDLILTDDSFKLQDNIKFLNTIKTRSPDSKYYFYTSDTSTINKITSETNFPIHTLLSPVKPTEVQRLILSDLFPPKKKKILYNLDVNFMKTFITCTNEVMEEMAQIEEMVNFSPFILGDKSKKIETVAIRGTLAIKTKHFTGTFYISFPESTYLRIYEKILGERDDKITDENMDLGAEFANIIFGKAKRVLNNDGYDLGMVVPNVEFEEKIASKFDVIVIPMFTELGNFYIKIAPNYIKKA